MIEFTVTLFAIAIVGLFVWIGRKAWHTHQVRDEVFKDKRALVLELLRVEAIRNTALSCGVFTRQGLRNLLSQIDAWEAGHWDVLMCRLFEHRKVRRSISAYMWKIHGVPRRRFEDRMELFAAGMLAAKATAEKISRKRTA